MQYLYDPNLQFVDTGGSPLVGGHLEVYLAYTDDAAATYTSLEATTLNPQKITLDSNGRAVVAVDETVAYRLEVYDAEGLLLWTVQPYHASGTTVNTPVEVTGTDGEIDVSTSVSAEKKIFRVSLSDAVKTELEDLGGALAIEAATRAGKDSELEKMLTAEAEARADADSALQKTIEEEQKAIAGKQDKLTAGDNIAISEASVISVTGRKRLKVKSPLTATADGESLTLGFAGGIYATADALAAEAEARGSADSALQANIDSEAAERQTEDTFLQAQISAEAANRETADTTLQTNIDGEATAREAADSALRQAIDGKQDKLTFDEEPKSESANPVTSGGVYDALYELSSEIDTTLTKLLDGKQDKLTFDEEPTSGSSNPVTSGGIYNAIQSEAGTRASQTTTNAKNITAEANARKSADDALQAQIDALSTDMGDYTVYGYPTATAPEDAAELFSFGNLAVYAYTDSAAALRLILKATDGNTHKCFTNGGVKDISGSTTSTISTSFTTSAPYLRFHCLDGTDSKFYEYELYSFNNGYVAESMVLVRKLTEQTIGGSDG